MMKRVLQLLLSSIIVILCAAPLSSAADPEGPIYLWEGMKVPFGHDTRLYVCRPEHPNGISIIVCPGGSYHWLDEKGEGLEVGEWLSSKGITAFVLMYRTAGAPEIAWHSRIIFRGKRHPDMISDAQRAIQYVWENSSEYGIDRQKIGMMGFSAGGHLVLSATCYHSTDFLKKSYGIETDAGLNPAFVASIYPVVTMSKPYVHARSRRGLLGDNRLLDKRMKDSLSIEKHIPEDCSPIFVINCVDDPVVDYHNSVILDSVLTEKHIRHKYIQYKKGKHGFGVSDYYGSPECREWKNEFLVWLEETLSPQSL